MQKSIQLSCALAIAGVFLGGCDDKTLFQAPPRGGEAMPALAPSDSVITLVAKAPYTALNQAAEAKIPRSVPLSSDNHVACADVPHVNPSTSDLTGNPSPGVCEWQKCSRIAALIDSLIGSSRCSLCSLDTLHYMNPRKLGAHLKKRRTTITN
jgi:hypothetical protein